jgi:PAS domain S-box-containing protein
MRQKDKNGNTLFVSINVKFDASSKTIFGTIVDQTEIAEKSSQIEKINAELENILTYVDKSSDAIMVTDEKGVFRYVNKTAQIRYGIDDLSESKTHIWDVQVKQFSREDLANHFHELQSKKKLTQRTQHKNIKTGEILQVELNVSLHIAKTGERFIIASARDISYTIEKENEILAINRSLEETVQNEIRKNLTLTSSISKQEKFSVIGEIAAGISHDLRTPLTTMKLGANNIELIIQEIFRILTTELNQQDVQLAFDAYQNLINEELFVGGMQLLKDKKNLLEFLAQKYPEYSETELSKLANSFSKARLTLQKSNLVEEIMNTAQPLNISELIFNLKAIMLFNEGISQSAEKSLAVIGNLNSFIKSEEAKKGTVNLSESIRNALDVLKYVTPENITIDNELDNNIELEAYPSQLFQIWLNIIRNAIEAIGEKEDGKISILTTHDETYGIIRITNNGPKVPDDVVDNIFNQFYTTKSSQGGSGLGLSVVKKVVESHYGQIELINKDNSVTFVIRLKSKHD